MSQPRPATEKSPYFDMENKFGVEFDFHQFIRIEEVTPKEFRAQHINILDYTAIIFNSRHGIDHFFHLCQQMRIVVPESMHYYCISESIANYLQRYIQYRKRKVFFGAHNRFEDVLPAMQRRPSEKYMMVVSDIHNDDTIQMFASHKIQVTPAVMYRTVINDFTKEEKKAKYDMFVLFTPMGVKAFRKNFPKIQDGDKYIGCFGQNTLLALKEEGFTPVVMAPTPECQSITTALEKFLEQNALEVEEVKKPAVKKTTTAKTTATKTTAAKTTATKTAATKTTTAKTAATKTTTAKTTAIKTAATKTTTAKTTATKTTKTTTAKTTAAKKATVKKTEEKA